MAIALPLLVRNSAWRVLGGCFIGWLLVLEGQAASVLKATIALVVGFGWDWLGQWCAMAFLGPL